MVRLFLFLANEIVKFMGLSKEMTTSLNMNYPQPPHTILMIRPVAFGHNDQTASSNTFQQNYSDLSPQSIQQLALTEFDAMVQKLESHDIPVMVFEDTAQPVKPDAIFPNNWVSMQPDGQVLLYPMEAENRRGERRTEIVERLQNMFDVSGVTDLSYYEKEGRFLEGTGSIIFDHVNKVAYANYSSRTDKELFEEVCEKLGYNPVGFKAVDRNDQDIYHTNVMMCVGTEYALICLDAITEEQDLDLVINSLNGSGRKIISISYDQMGQFAGNMFEVLSTSGERYLVMSETAFQSLVNGQINAITQFLDIITIDIPTIEQHGGGSVRCIMAGIHLPVKA